MTRLQKASTSPISEKERELIARLAQLKVENAITQKKLDRSNRQLKKMLNGREKKKMTDKKKETHHCPNHPQPNQNERYTLKSMEEEIIKSLNMDEFLEEWQNESEFFQHLCSAEHQLTAQRLHVFLEGTKIELKRLIVMVHQLFGTLPDGSKRIGLKFSNKAGPECTRHTNTTFLYAYSTDADPYDVHSGVHNIVFRSMYRFVGFTTFANIRFDTKQKEEIQYHSDVLSFNASVSSRLPDRALGYNDNPTGSDIFEIIQKYLENQESTTCGSLLYIVVKRYPNQVDITNLITQLRENHVFVYIIAHEESSGGNNPHSLYEVASKTNGYCIFANRAFWMPIDMGTDLIAKHQFISDKFLVSGSGRITVPIYQIPIRDNDHYTQPYMIITIQDYAIYDKPFSMNYTINSTDESHSVTGPFARYGTGVFDFPQLINKKNYSCVIDYNYYSDEEQIMEIKLYTLGYHDFLPFTD